MTTTTTSPRKAVVLLSGGLDSATVLAIARDAGYECYCLSIDYGQRHTFELNAASAMAKAFNASEHITLNLDLAKWGGSALTSDIEVPKERTDEAMSQAIPITYVPARNTVFLSLALAWAEVLGAFDIFIGVNAVDYSGYPDCRPEFIEQFARLSNLATQAGVEGKGKFQIHTPLIHLTKAQIIERGLSLGVDYGKTHTCYDPLPDGHPCGRCDSCQLRQKGFAEIGMSDPATTR
ncbi:7-cyano-7-deazaguanine synthase QueC [Planctomicrobium sp. SH668]|uniref:7-cyano-7-deazaguanine synthase QueC n=1 Tax=Planctomicrobium sp. SH668 TaxID=3448126 RepID=UPI003F5B9295